MAILHPSRSLTALVPQYASRFSCIGSSCEDTCCAGWQISLDKKTFNAYRQSTHTELKPLFESSVKRRRSQSSDSNYGRIELQQPSAACPLEQDRLCSVQKNLNESFLSDTCFSYPRSTRQLAGTVEQSLTLSCPEAARQALLNADAFDFVENRVMVRDTMTATVKPVHGLDVATMNEIRIFCFQVMRTEGLALWQKLAVLGVFCESLTGAIKAGKQQAIASLMQQCIDLLESGSVTEALKDMQPNHGVQASLFAALWTARAITPPSNSQREIVEMIAERMRTDDTDARSPQEQVIDLYRRGIERLPLALESAPWLLDHYVLNELFSTLFPFATDNPYEDFMRLISRFGMVRFMLAAQCSGTGELPSPALLARTVQVFCRRVQHDNLFASKTSEALHSRGWDRLEHVYSFLRY